MSGAAIYRVDTAEIGTLMKMDGSQMVNNGATVTRPLFDQLDSGSFRFRDLKLEDAGIIAPFLRDCDFLGLRTIKQRPVLEKIRTKIRQADYAFSLDFNGCCTAIFGLVHREEKGYTRIWLVGSDRFERALQKGGSKRCRKWLAALMQTQQHSLLARVPSNDLTSLRWLYWLGFEEDTAEGFEERWPGCKRMILNGGG